MEIFNIFGQLEAEIQDFEQKGVYIAGKPKNDYEANHTKGERGGYYHSQRDLLESIDLASASKYKKGIFDTEGQRKTYLNIVNFYRDVMKMKIGIRVSNYIFSPNALDFSWVSWVFDRMFKLWALMAGYDDQISEYAHDLSTYGSCVAIRLDKCTERVPLRTLKNTQTAKSLLSAALYGGYVLIEGEYHYNEMSKYPDWDLNGLDTNGTFHTFMRFALVPAGLLDKWATMDDIAISKYVKKADEAMVAALAIIIPEGASKTFGQHILYMEGFDEDTFPIEECHVDKVDGRWIGRGEIEKQLENQISRNLNANFRRRGILWGAKKIFYSDDENIQQNLVMEVKDGTVLKLGKGRTAGQLNTTNQHAGEISTDEQSWEDNSKQNAFAFEVATGESLPSGTPFRLGIVLQQSVAQHFTDVRQIFSNFLIRCYFDQLIPLFKKDHRGEHEAIISLGESGIENMREELITYHTNLRIFDAIINDKRPDTDLIKQQVQAELERNAYASITVPAKTYDDIEVFMTLNLVDDIGPTIAELTSLYEAMVQKGDPRADNVLKQIFATRGKALPALLGPAPEQSANPQIQAPGSDSPGKVPPVPVPANATA